ncbi:MAG: acyl-CoA thioesterase [Acidimicrobiales bacterium]
MSAFRHEIRVRYAEVDMQRHVFNAHYLTYVDDAFDAWLRAALGDYHSSGVLDMVLKRADVTWHGNAGFGDVLGVDVAARRWAPPASTSGSRARSASDRCSRPW